MYEPSLPPWFYATQQDWINAICLFFVIGMLTLGLAAAIRQKPMDSVTMAGTVFFWPAVWCGAAFATFVGLLTAIVRTIKD